MTRRIFSDYAYGFEPRKSCWWDETCDLPDRPAASGHINVDVAIIGGGYTGLSAAYHLAQAGVSVVLLEAEYIGWGASGRNGGFCCLGGSKAGDNELDRRFGKSGRLEFRQAELAAVSLVEDLIERLNLDVDRHSNGETELAHRAKDMSDLRRRCATVRENYGVDATLVERENLAEYGFSNSFFGALTTPIGFALNPRKYVAGLASAAESVGAKIFQNSSVRRVVKDRSHYVMEVDKATIRAEQVVFALNGYASETLPPGMAGRYLPTQSNVLVTRPLEIDELEAQGWTSEQMSFDTRNLLHYFRLMPDRRFLFGMRGGILTGSRADAHARRATRRHFDRMFPAWKQVKSEHSWSGMVCLARDKLPFVGQIENMPSAWTAMCFHGNGVAMGTFSGKIIAHLVQGTTPDLYPAALRQTLSKFPFGSARRVCLPPVYAGLMLADL